MKVKIKKLLDRYALNKEPINSRKSILRKYECTGNYITDIIPLLEDCISLLEKRNNKIIKAIERLIENQ